MYCRLFLSLVFMTFVFMYCNPLSSSYVTVIIVPYFTLYEVITPAFCLVYVPISCHVWSSAVIDTSASFQSLFSFFMHLVRSSLSACFQESLVFPSVHIMLVISVKLNSFVFITLPVCYLWIEPNQDLNHHQNHI